MSRAMVVEQAERWWVEEVTRWRWEVVVGVNRPTNKSLRLVGGCLKVVEVVGWVWWLSSWSMLVVSRVKQKK